MYTSMKKISTITIILSCVGLVGALLTYLYLDRLPTLAFLDRLSIYFYLFPAAIISVMHGVALWKAQSELNLETESQLEKLSAMKKKIDELEKKIAYLERS